MKLTRWRMPPESWAGLELLKPREPEPLEQRPSSLAGLAAPATAVLEGDRRVVERRAPWQQEIALRHHGATRQSVLGRPRSGNVERAGIGVEQAGHDLEEGGLAATARTEDGHLLVLVDGHVDAPERDNPAEAL